MAMQRKPAWYKKRGQQPLGYKPPESFPTRSRPTPVAGKTLPPGLAKKPGGLPPGIAKKFGPAQYGGATPSKQGPVMVGDYRRTAIKQVLGEVGKQPPARKVRAYPRPKRPSYGRRVQQGRKARPAFR